MKFVSAAISALWLASANAQIHDIPAVDSIVSSALSTFSAYVTEALQSAATPAPKPYLSPHRPGNRPAAAMASVPDAPYWLADITHQGIAAFNGNPSTYQVFRSVKDFGAVGDGVTDDTAAINAAISSGSRLSPASRRTSTVTPAVVYFPAGTYLISAPIVDFYYTQLIGNPNSLPVIKASSSFPATWMIDGDQYQSDGNQGWASVNVFYRQIRNLILDMTAVPANRATTGIHWPTGQATSISNVQVIMSSAPGTQHQGIFIENGMFLRRSARSSLMLQWLN